MGIVKTTAKSLAYLALFVFVIYAGFISDNRNLKSYALIAMAAVLCYWWIEGLQVAQAREQRKSQVLFDRIAYLEEQMLKMESDYFELEQKVRDIEKSSPSTLS